MSINISDLAEEVIRALEGYTERIAEEIPKVCEEVAKECVKELKQTSPKQSGNYAKSWAYKKQVGGRNRAVTFVVHNKKHYRLTHLLEKGHAKRGGGRTRAMPHIAQAESRAMALLGDKILEAIANETS